MDHESYGCVAEGDSDVRGTEVAAAARVAAARDAGSRGGGPLVQPVDDLPTACAAREGRRCDAARAGRATRAAHAVRGGARRACRAGARSRGGGTCRAGLRTAWAHAGTDRRDPDGGAGDPAAG